MKRAPRMIAAVSLALTVTAAANGNGDGCLDDPDSGLTAPEGFCAQIVAEDLGPLGQLDVTSDGDVYAAVQDTEDRHGGVIGLRDTTGDGRLDEQVTFGERGATGLAVRDGRLYVGEPERILSSPLHPDRLGPADNPEVIAHGLPDSAQPRALVIRSDALYVSVAADSRYCESDDNRTGALDPCPERERAGGIWRFSVDQAGQTQGRDTLFAAGIRDATAMRWNARDDHLYAINPALPDNTGEAAASAMLRVTRGSDYGWPYCLFNTALNRYLQAAAYGGDGESVRGCSAFQPPLHMLAGSVGPTALLFYQGHQFPEAYRRAAFVAFNGSTADNEPARIERISLDEDGRPVGETTPFAEGLEVTDHTVPRRILGLAQGSDGSLFVSDTQAGTIWRLEYTGTAGEND